MTNIESCRPVETCTEDYWSHAKHPLASLLFVLPILLTYEAGLFFCNRDAVTAVRNGADEWLRSALAAVGLSQPYLLPLLVVAGLLGWQIVGHYRWRLPLDVLPGMAAESVLFAFLLAGMGQVAHRAFACWQQMPHLAVSSAVENPSGAAITYLGAGLYEEFLFRLCLLPACYALCRQLRLPQFPAALIAIFSTSILFSLAHYLGTSPEAFDWFCFSFRLMAGLFFGILFVYRGFGITVGCHAAYDLLVGLLLT